MTGQTIEIGTTFRVKSNQYRGKKDIFTVVRIVPEHHADIVCTDAHGDVMCFNSGALKAYGIEILSRPAFDKALMKKAVAQTLAVFIALADGESDGSTKFAAVMKAADVIETVDISFDGTRLDFRSPYSKKNRIVTAAGCSDLCECKNKMSYHRAAFAILKRYTELQTENVIKFPARAKRRQLKKAA